MAPTSTSDRAEGPLLEVKDLRTHVFTKRGVGKAVDGVSFELHRGETLGIIGESGSGKSMTASSIVGLHPKPAARIVGGQILFKGQDLLELSDEGLQKIRGANISFILQDPMTALNPVFTIGSQIAEPLKLHRNMEGKALKDRSVELLRLLRISDPEERLNSYPHQLSGGMRQRVVGAIALSCEPDIVIADEPTTALDATVQAAYLAHLKEIQQREGMAILFITHDFGVVVKMCDAVAVMYAGRIVERVPTPQLLRGTSHPYTQALMESVPDVSRPTSRLIEIQGQPPPVTDPPTGCRFHPRCWLYEQLGRPESCREEVPELRNIAPNQDSACHFAETALETERIPREAHA